MQKKYLILGLVLSSCIYAANPNVAKKYVKTDFPLNYDLKSAYIYDKGYMAETFDRLALNIDDYNKRNNIKSDYFEKVADLRYDDVDEISVLFLEDEAKYYFGNKNQAKNIKILETDKFNEELNKAQQENKIKYYFKGDYINLYELLKFDKKIEKTVDDFRNPLSISIDEYESIKNKTKHEQALFLKERLDKVLSNLKYDNLIEEDGELYTVYNGEKHKLYWKLEPITIPDSLTEEERLNNIPRKYYDDVYNEIYIYIENINTISYFFNSKPIGKKFYTKDGDIVVEKLDYIPSFIEFRGKGYIDGEIDLDNKGLKIRGALSGKYGTRITLKPTASLKNIREIIVTDDTVGGADSGTINTGITTLNIDIDPNIKNEEGFLSGHALYNSDPNIVFRSDSDVSPNSFDVILMTSKIDKASTLATGRKMNYRRRVGYKYHDIELKLIPDSIVNTININENKDSNGNDLVDIGFKNSIKKLSKEENDIYKSIASSNKISNLSDTLSTVNKKVLFEYKEFSEHKKKQDKLANYLANDESNEKIINDLSEFNLDEKQKEQFVTYLNKIKETVKKDKQSFEDKKNKLEIIKEQEENIENFKNELRDFIKEVQSKKEELKNNKAAIEEMLNKLKNGKYYSLYKQDEYFLNPLSQTNSADFMGSIPSDLREVKKALDVENLNRAVAFLDLESTLDEAIKDGAFTTDSLGYKSIKSDYNKAIKDGIKLREHGSEYALEYRRLKQLLYYNLRQEEALKEFKTMLSQLQDTNIYSKMNKVAKNELTTYTNIPFDINRNLSEKKHLARGGYISSRNVQQNFKGNTYTAYGLYEKEFLADTKLGFMVGGSSTNHTLTHNKRTAKTTPATSSSKGISAYLGAYAGKKLYQELNWISGLGFQYGKYDITRNLRNNYQTLTSKGKVDILGLNAYSGLVLDYPLQEDVVVQVKGLLSYSFINQGKVREKEGLNLDINNKNYNYLDSEIGVNFSKTLYDFGVKSNLSAGIYRVMGVYGYKNSNLSAKINGSSHSFAIKGDKVQKDAVKLFIDYNVQKDSGLNYGLDGTYITNSKETDVRFGFKAGYTF